MKFFKTFSSIILFLFFVSCTLNNDFFSTEKPNQLLSEDKFITVFSDMILLESTVIMKSSNNIHTHKVMNVSSLKILKKHHVSKKQYSEAFDYYAQDKDKMMEVYTKILEEYNIKLSKLK